MADYKLETRIEKGKKLQTQKSKSPQKKERIKKERDHKGAPLGGTTMF